MLGENVVTVREPQEMKEQDSMLVIWGGADINSIYYKHPKHSTTWPGGLRDRLEWTLMNEAKDRGIPIMGVCRGAQMLCALAGGFLIQDVENHVGQHEVVTHDGNSFDVNSIHHQMMCMVEMPEDTYELLAWREGRSGAPYGYKDDKWFTPDENWKEPEFVYFPKINGYAVQWHPEAMRSESEATQYILKTVIEKENVRGTAKSESVTA